ncbi:uncharacterized protein ACA1_099370 [Acanthamoeba castellanii str. Neff]|uniref:Uncharacterized protein n=1 Tax=Acanthamoeba castellanii (strain ATCC 30010 / Neff) TaxID=1257118 RepID=L8HJ10_ACACF|nr:uncharacterized protein ACA1_099370 [Acanthamoeba castellanii str. Neff]ELR25579.1 hypothetical protein ACA1_099370 [Acanthamoeba castellanii str. Neff]
MCTRRYTISRMGRQGPRAQGASGPAHVPVGHAPASHRHRHDRSPIRHVFAAARERHGGARRQEAAVGCQRGQHPIK